MKNCELNKQKGMTARFVLGAKFPHQKLTYAPINVKPQGVWGEGGGGYPREFDSESLPLSGDFDISRCPQGREF